MARHAGETLESETPLPKTFPGLVSRYQGIHLAKNAFLSIKLLIVKNIKKLQGGRQAGGGRAFPNITEKARYTPLDRNVKKIALLHNLARNMKNWADYWALTGLLREGQV